MVSDLRWDPCIKHMGREAEEFLEELVGLPGRKVLLVAGAGFDPRSCTVSRVASRTAANVHGLFVKEVRPYQPSDQVRRASANAAKLARALPKSRTATIDIFEGDSAVVGGRNVVVELEKVSLDGLTDIMVDVSALSVGVSFPAIRYLWEQSLASECRWNLHLLATHDPQIDISVRSVPGDTVGYVRGFKGGITLSAPPGCTHLWLPQLAPGRVSTLRRLHSFLSPDDVCPVLPFPASNPRLGDELIEEYMVELEDTWSVDGRSFVYANEADPLDFYRTVLSLDDRRQPVFQAVGGTVLVLTVVGSKMMAVGALMAAMERDLPVLHLEPSGYQLAKVAPLESNGGELVHIWLEGEAYPHPRPARMVRGT